jgi:hypothetical protein
MTGSLQHLNLTFPEKIESIYPSSKVTLPCIAKLDKGIGKI